MAINDALQHLPDTTADYEVVAWLSELPGRQLNAGMLPKQPRRRIDEIKKQTQSYRRAEDGSPTD
jgi:hypothetical protein